MRGLDADRGLPRFLGRGRAFDKSKPVRRNRDAPLLLAVGEPGVDDAEHESGYTHDGWQVLRLISNAAYRAERVQRSYSGRSASRANGERCRGGLSRRMFTRWRTKLCIRERILMSRF